MPAVVVLLLCTAFVLFLLGLEQRAAPKNSLALWIPTTWILIIASRPLVEWFAYIGPGGVTLDNDSGSSIDRWVLILLAAVAIAVLMVRRFDWWSCIRQNKWFLVLLAYMFLSTLWSDITLTAMKRWTREAIVPIMVMVVLSEANPRQAMEALFRRTAYVLLPFSIVLIKYYPHFGVVYGKYSGILMWTGVTGQKNQLGRLCAISALFLLVELYRYWKDRKSNAQTLNRKDRSRVRTDVAVLLMALYLLKGSDSSTSQVTLVLGLLVFGGLLLYRRLKIPVPRTGLFAFVMVFMAFGVATPFLGGSDVAKFTSTVGRDDTLTGRTEVWAAVLPARALHPLLGYGYGSFWTDARRKLYDIPTSHNGYLDVLLELGDVGLAFYALWLLACAGQMHRALAREYEWSSLGIAYLLMGSVYNTTESALNSPSEHMTAVTVFVSFLLSSGLVLAVNRNKTLSPAWPNKSSQAPVFPAWSTAPNAELWQEAAPSLEAHRNFKGNRKSDATGRT